MLADHVTTKIFMHPDVRTLTLHNQHVLVCVIQDILEELAEEDRHATIQSILQSYDEL
jgi:hypothetical protein